MFDQENIFKFIIGTGIFLFTITVCGLFLLGLKIALLFFPEITAMGLVIRTF
jgi:hypothetical protein